MKQILQNLKTGKTELVEVPCPAVKAGHLLIRTTASLVSAGTERMLVDFGKAGYLQKARQQPEKVKQVLDKIRTDGLMPTIEAVKSKLDQPLALGYCNVGRVTEVGGQRSEVRGQRSEGLKVGDRVVSNGPHAEIVCVPNNLCAKIPDGVTDEQAAFTVLGSIALQGMRLAAPTFGEKFIVFGMGLIGLLTVQLLQANGCEVLAVDLNAERLKLAEAFGAQTVNISAGGDPVAGAMAVTEGKGVDGVLITASAKTDEIVHQAAEACRKRGRIVLVGVVGLNLRRSDFFEKEITFQVSCSYGPGRYDDKYEQDGQDYPIGYVRWTEQRNFEAVLGALEAGRLRVDEMITHRYPFEEAEKAYELISENKEAYVGIILDYKKEDASRKGAKALSGLEVRSQRTVWLKEPSLEGRLTSDLRPPTSVSIGLIGAGNFTGAMLLPALKKTGARLKTIASSGGVSGTHLGKKFGFEESTTDANTIFSNPEINAVFITTQHNTHAGFVMQALEADKHVFVEKPLCISQTELEEIIKVYSDLRPPTSDFRLLMVGFNRRFSAHIIKMKELLETVREPKSMIMTVNAGMIPVDHWTQDSEVGGGRIIGEACHFIDLLRFLVGEKIVKYDKAVMQSRAGDTLSINLSFADGSIGTVHYFANGNKSFPKERLEVFCGEKILQLDNFKVLRGCGWKGFKKMKLWRQDKGHRNEIRSFVNAVEHGNPSPIPFEEIIEVTKISLELAVDKRR